MYKKMAFYILIFSFILLLSNCNLIIGYLDDSTENPTPDNTPEATYEPPPGTPESTGTPGPDPTVMPPPQSHIPAGDDNYLHVVSRMDLGGRDLVNVVFYEVPDTISSPLYFGIRDPEGNNILPDIGDYPLLTTYSLIGGHGTLSDSRSRMGSYGIPALEHKTGTILHEYMYDNTLTAIQGPDPAEDNAWVYFPGVDPAQGEHIGNKYYFKVVAECMEHVAEAFYNAYQLDISVNNTGSPTGVSNVRAFSYSWMLCFENRAAHTWELFPFVPDNAAGDIIFLNFDMDYEEEAFAYNIDKSFAGTIALSGNGALAETAFPITQTNGTWTLEVRETINPPEANAAELWFENSLSREVYRSYAYHYIPDTFPDHIAVNCHNGSAYANGTDYETIVIQVVDFYGNPIPYSRYIYVQVSGTARIVTANNTPVAPTNEMYIYTDSSGIATISVTDSTVETVSVIVTTNGRSAPGIDPQEANLPGNNESIDIDFTF